MALATIKPTAKQRRNQKYFEHLEITNKYFSQSLLLQFSTGSGTPVKRIKEKNRLRKFTFPKIFFKLFLKSSKQNEDRARGGYLAKGSLSGIQENPQRARAVESQLLRLSDGRLFYGVDKR